MSPVPANNREPNKQDDPEDANAADAPQFVINNSDSDSEGDEEDGYQGYQLLPQEPEVHDGADTEGGVPHYPGHVTNMDGVIMQALDNQDMMNAVALQGQPDVSQEVTSETVELWNTDNTNPTAQEPMDPEHAEKIKSAMAGFTLPVSAQPAWANQLSEEDWKDVLMKKCSPNVLGAMRCGQSTSQNSKNDEKGKDKPLER